MMNAERIPSLLALLAASLLSAGCGSSTGPVPVTGKLTFNDQPLAGALVQLVAQDEGGRDARGTTAADGAFQLTTDSPRDGALPGNYKVVIHYSEPVKLPEGLKTPEEVQAAMAEAAAKHVPTIVLPASYGRADETPLSYRVPGDGELCIDIKSN